MYDEDDLLPISALQHLAFCERQWALIYLEGLWSENVLTAQGRQLHDRTDRPETETRGDLRVARGLRIRSLRLGLTGRADVVEFHRLPPGSQGGVRLAGADDLWQPFPVEYKRGRPKADHCDEVQLCAQALCLEEMLGVPVPKGALFYGMPRRRTDVEFNSDLRDETVALAAHLHQLTQDGKTPPPPARKRCRNCSLRQLCLPAAVRRGKAGDYTARMIAHLEDNGP